MSSHFKEKPNIVQHKRHKQQERTIVNQTFYKNFVVLIQQMRNNESEKTRRTLEYTYNADTQSIH